MITRPAAAAAGRTLRVGQQTTLGERARMGKIIAAIKSPPGMFILGGLVTLAVDRRTGGKVSAAVAKVPVLGKLVVG
jgi:hypothetical protein